MELSNIQSPDDIKLCSYKELEALAEEIRQEIITTVANNGGHLASNLGVVELTLAIHRMFDTPRDKIIFDVGHQTYVHKLLTGRYKDFETLRTYGGISGFPRRCESEYDCYDTGHASTSVSAALGMARARDYQNQDYSVVAVIGDGALTGGMCYEALNDAGHSKTPMIIILNDNEMSISKNVGALAQHLTTLRVSRRWNKTKKALQRFLTGIPIIGKPVYKFLDWLKDSVRNFLVDESFFSALGFRYLGPIDGHDLPNLEYVLAKAKEFKEPVLIHCITKKGHGYVQAESKPEIFHGIPPFYTESGETRDKTPIVSYGAIAAEKLTEMARSNTKICAVTAAMPGGTGLSIFGAEFSDRLIDVGIAEQHAITMASGLCNGGMRPYVAIYSTFMQRGYDQILHDVCLQGLPVCLLIDRAGIVGEDGATHHGVFDIAYLRHIPNMHIFAPASKSELKLMLEYTNTMKTPCAIRYPRTMEQEIELNKKAFTPGRWDRVANGSDICILATGSMVASALEVNKILQKHNISARVINACSIKPLDGAMLKEVKDMPLFTMEEHVTAGGFGSAVSEHCIANHYQEPLKLFGIPDAFIHHGSREKLLAEIGLSPEQMANAIINRLGPKFLLKKPGVTA